MRPRALLAALAAAAVVAPATASAPAAAPATQATGRAIGVRIVVPGGKEIVLAAAGAPPAREVNSSGLAYGEAVVATGAASTRADARRGPRARATTAATIRGASLFGGEITVGTISARALAHASPTGAGATLSGSALARLVILGQAVQASPNERVALGDWGYAVLLEQAIAGAARGHLGHTASVSGLHVHLTAEHGGLPAGTDIFLGYAEAAASAAKAKPAPRRPRSRPAPNAPPPPAAAAPSKPSPPPPAAAPSPTPSPSPTRRPPSTPVAPPSGPPRDPQPNRLGAKREPPPIVRKPTPAVRPRFTADGYVFPVYGPSAFSDDFGAPRALTGWHHGNDIFAPAGAPVLAATDGTLFLVGWNDVGGNRLWLRDDRGNELYYAHLSAFSPLAFDGSRVQAGDVIGFVGATGDAVGTPPHLHFEIHPAALLGLGYDGVTNPYRYLLAWRRLSDVPFAGAEAKPGVAPPPGLVLLQADDISSASGLDPEALARVLATPALFGEGLSPSGGGASRE